MWQPVFMISGYILGILGIIMLIPAGVDLSEQGVEWSHFIASAMISIFFGFSLFLSNHTKVERISLKQAYLVTTISWVLVSLFAAVPFVFYNATPNITDAFFEAVSGITGTGATIIGDVEKLPRSMLLWRSMLNYLGGLGVVIFAVALLPFLGIGGMQMFQRENSDSNDKFMPKFSYIAKRIMVIYFVLTILCAGALFFAGMNWFDAVNHAMTTISTGGFSTKNNSIAFYDSALIECIVMVGMLAGALPMTFYILLLRRGAANKNDQVSVFLKLILFYSLFVSVYLYVTSDYSLFQSLRYSFFTIIAITTTAGLSSCDYVSWGIWATALIMLFSLTGGCTGSTAGSIKVFRWQTLYAFLRKYLLSAIEPHRVIPLKIGNTNASEGVTMSVFIYVLSFLINLVLIAVVVSLCGWDFNTSLASVLACITNVGVGSVEVIGPNGNFAFFSAPVKYLLCFAMILGRLEIITVLVLFSKSFWRN